MQLVYLHLFALFQGIFDGVCAGILLYLGFALLMTDFTEDMRQFTEGGAKGHGWRRYAMYLSLWAGAGCMAAIGRYL